MFSLSWVIGSGEDAHGGNTGDVQVEIVMETVELILRKSGSVTIDVVDGDELGPECLQIESEGGKSVISLGENTKKDYVVRTYTNKYASHGQVSILGNVWDLKMVCEDSSIVKTIVTEFISTKYVSRSLLN